VKGLKAAALATSLALAAGSAQAREASAALEASASVRLSQDQYRQSILDIFGPAIQLTGRFEPGIREETTISLAVSLARWSIPPIERPSSRVSRNR
jgi:hypothetical protein